MANVKALEKSPNCVFFEYQLTGTKFLIPINKDVQHRIQTGKNCVNLICLNSFNLFSNFVCRANIHAKFCETFEK